MKIDEIKDWVEKYHIIARTKEGFINWLYKYREEEINEYNKIMKDSKFEDLLFELHTVSLNIGNWPDCNYNTVTASMRIFINNKLLFNYTAQYLLNGEDDDDFIDII